MKLFICEFITGGGMQDVDLPVSLAHEGDLMLSALLADLHEAGFDDICCTRDARLKGHGNITKIINPGKDVWQTWRQCMAQCDAVWIIAPETGGVLYELSSMAREENCLLIGCTPEAVKITSSKSMTLEYLSRHQLPCVPVLNDIGNVTDEDNAWVIKPDDGVGGDGCYLFTDLNALQSHINQVNREKYIVQNYVDGIPASISMLCNNGRAILLACNQQLFEFIEGKGQLNGIIVNGLRHYADEFAEIAGLVTSAIEGLQGYVGIDLVVSDQGPKILEVNPRLTTAYAGLKQSLGINPAAIILETQQTGRFPDMVGLDYQPVTVRF